jgi:hypothetical protein
VVRDASPNRPRTASPSGSQSTGAENLLRSAASSDKAGSPGWKSSSLRIQVDDETRRRLGPQFRSESPQRGEVVKPPQDRPPGPAYYHPVTKLQKPTHLNLDRHWS